MNLKDLEPIHRTAVRTALLDLCHAHGALIQWEPELARLVRVVTRKMAEQYPDLHADLWRRPADFEPLDNTPRE